MSKGWEIACEAHGNVTLSAHGTTQRWFNFRDAEAIERDHLKKFPGCQTHILKATTSRTSSARGYHA